MKITIEQLNEKINLLRKIDLSKNDKLTYATKKVSKSYQESLKKPMEIYNSKLEDTKLQLASIDAEGNLITTNIDERGNSSYKYTPENNIKLLKEFSKAKEEYNSIEVEFEPYLVDINSSDYSRAKSLFDDFEVEELIGILFTSLDSHGCKTGETWDGTKCVVSPIPPDPTHPQQ